MLNRAFFSSALLVLLAGAAFPQATPFICNTGAVNPVVRAEGVAEPLGDILINCSGGAPGAVLTFNLALFLNVSVTNHVAANGSTDVVLTVDSGSGPVPSGVAGLLQTQNSVSFNGATLTVPAPGSVVALRITNLRGNVSQLGAGGPQRPVLATISINGTPSTISYNTNQVVVGVPQTGLFGILSDTGIRCTGSPLPSTINYSGLLSAGTRFVSTRVTEGFPTAFEKKAANADNGVRIVARYKGLPAGARLFVSDVIAGSDAVQPTVAGDLGGTVSGGSYAPGGAGSLLLVRVRFTDANGAGGQLAYTPGAPGSGTVSFDSASEVPLNNGAGIAVYEVVDSNPSILESAQFATFLGLAPIPDGTGPIATEDVSFGPISTIGTATATDPIPRFVSAVPPSDCPILGDCNAAYFPALSVSAARPLEYTLSAGMAPQTRTVMINNTGGGVLNWTATLSGVTGSGWVAVTPSYGVNGGTVLVTITPNVAAGVYTGTLNIDGGPLAGSRALPIKLTVVNGPVFPIPGFPVPPLTTVTSLISAARPDSTAVSPGSLANVKGAHLGGKDALATFDGTPAQIVSRAADFITLVVPESLSAPKKADLQVTVDGDKSLPLSVQISELAPAIFPNGVLNEDYSANTTSNPAAVGSSLLILATGLKNGGSPATAQVRLHDRTLTPSAAGLVPGLLGISLVIAVIPNDLPAMTTYMFLCGIGSAGPNQPVCSQVESVTLK